MCTTLCSWSCDEHQIYMSATLHCSEVVPGVASDTVWLWWKVNCNYMFCDLLYLCTSSRLLCPNHVYLNGFMYCRLVLWQGYQCYVPLFTTFHSASSLMSLSSPPIVCMDYWVSSWLQTLQRLVVCRLHYSKCILGTLSVNFWLTSLHCWVCPVYIQVHTKSL